MSEITIYIPALPQKSYAYRLGDAQIIHDEDGHAIVIDGGEDILCNALISYCKKLGITHVTYILSHWHPDHDRGLRLFLNSSIVIDKIIAPPPSDLTKLRDSDARSDYSRASAILAVANRLNKTVVYPKANTYMTETVGPIVCKIWRRSINTSENVDYQVNNTSLCCYFPDFYYVTTGDTINAFDTFLRTKPGKIVIFKVPHHGNACTEGPCDLLEEAGAELCYYNHAEAAGVGIGGDSFSKWGAGYCKKHFVTLRPYHAITMKVADKTLTVLQNGSVWQYSVPYADKAVEGWKQNSKGWWYKLSNGYWAVGWKKLKWSGGENWFYFDTNGYMVTGWIKVNGYWYYLDPKTGAMLTGWLDWNGKKCYLEPDENKNQGHAYMSEVAIIDGKAYSFDVNCYATEIEGPAVSPTRPSIRQNPNFKGYNVSKRTDPILYIVIHYTGAEGTAKNNIDYFNGGNRNASADFFVGHNGEIWQYNPSIKELYSWHCGGGRQSSSGGSYYGKCKNANSIGIELCTHKQNGEWVFTEQTVEAARLLVRYLMATYNIKQKNVIRHWDVNGKYCPNVYGWLTPSTRWDKFKASLSVTTQYDDAPQIYRIRKSWAEADTQVGAFVHLDNARTELKKHPGYHIYDKDGKEVT